MGIEIVQDDITTLDVDAIVTAANAALLGGGGVDGAIHRAAGPGLLAECKALPQIRPGVRCPTGEARITGGHALPARHVIHTVGPVWSDGNQGEALQLASCYRSAIALAVRHGVQSIAFPAISTGVYGYPPQDAAEVAILEMQAGLTAHATLKRIIACCFDDSTATIYRRLLELQKSKGRGRKPAAL